MPDANSPQPFQTPPMNCTYASARRPQYQRAKAKRGGKNAQCEGGQLSVPNLFVLHLGVCPQLINQPGASIYLSIFAKANLLTYCAPWLPQAFPVSGCIDRGRGAIFSQRAAPRSAAAFGSPSSPSVLLGYVLLASLLLVATPGAPSSVLAPSSTARSP